MKNLFVLFLCFFSFTCKASHDINGYYYDLDYNTKEASFCGVNKRETYSSYVDIPETVTYYGTVFTVTSIKEYCFANNSSLHTIIMPKSLKRIEHDAFAYCFSLGSVTLSDGIDFIGDNAFQMCLKLKEIRLPNTSIVFGTLVFDGCGIQDLYCYADKPTQYSLSAFSLFYNNNNYTNTTLHVPEEALDNYKNTSPWNRFVKTVPIETSDIKQISIMEQEGKYNINGIVTNKEKGLFILKNGKKNLIK